MSIPKTQSERVAKNTEDATSLSIRVYDLEQKVRDQSAEIQDLREWVRQERW